MDAFREEIRRLAPDIDTNLLAETARAVWEKIKEGNINLSEFRQYQWKADREFQIFMDENEDRDVVERTLKSRRAFKEVAADAAQKLFMEKPYLG